jgi:hypothetical protein
VYPGSVRAAGLVVRDWPDEFLGESKITSAPSWRPASSRWIIRDGQHSHTCASGDGLRVRRAPERRAQKFDPFARSCTSPFATGSTAAHDGRHNVWSTMVADEARHHPASRFASPDSLSGMRKNSNLYSSSLVALDATTGPSGISIGTPGIGIRRIVHALLAESSGMAVPAGCRSERKRASCVFDRTNGKPLFPIERPVPQDGLPGDSCRYQPFPGSQRHWYRSPWRRGRMGFTFWDRKICRRQIRRARRILRRRRPAAHDFDTGSAGGATGRRGVTPRGD